MVSDGETHIVAGVAVDVPPKRRGKKTTKKAEKLPADPSPSDPIPLPPTEVSDEEQEDLPHGVPEEMEWPEMIEIALQGVEANRYRLNQLEIALQGVEA